MHDDEHHAEIPTDPLKRVPPIALIGIALDVRPPGKCEEHTEHGVEHDGEEQQSPLQENQGWQIVDELDFVLEGFDSSMAVVRLVEPTSPDDRRVGSEVRQKEHANGKDARQRVQSPQQEIVSIKEPVLAMGHGRVPSAQELLRGSISISTKAYLPSCLVRV